MLESLKTKLMGTLETDRFLISVKKDQYKTGCGKSKEIQIGRNSKFVYSPSLLTFCHLLLIHTETSFFCSVGAAEPQHRSTQAAEMSAHSDFCGKHYFLYCSAACTYLVADKKLMYFLYKLLRKSLPASLNSVDIRS